MGNVKLVGSKNLVDPSTGEIINCEIISQDCQNKRRNFYILYMYNLMKIFDVFGGAKYKVLEFFIDNMNNDNQLIMTIKEISEKSGISRKTVGETLQILEDNNLIVRKVGCFM